MSKRNYIYFIFVVIWIFFSYFIFFFTDNIKIINFLAYEDGFIEYIGAIFFLLSGILFCFRFLKNENSVGFFIIKNKNLYFFLLSCLFILACLEEISWGQRLFNVSTPQILQDANIQNEINLHNLKILNIKIPGFSKEINFNLLFQLFWFIFGCLTPVLYKYNNKTKYFFNKINLPVGPLVISFFFIFNYFCSRIIQFVEINYLKHQDIIEIKESNAALIFFLLSIWFLKRSNKSVNIKENVVKEIN